MIQVHATRYPGSKSLGISGLTIDRSLVVGVKLGFTSEALQDYYLERLYTGKVVVPSATTSQERVPFVSYIEASSLMSRAYLYPSIADDYLQ